MISVRDFCRRTGAALVVKSRAKNRDPRYLRGSADLFVESDDGVFPYTSIELMAIADLCIHFQSGAVLEAAHAGVPSLSVRVPQSHLEEYPGHDQLFGGHEGTLQKFAGVVWSMEHDEAAARLGRLTLADFKIDPDARRRYIERSSGSTIPGAASGCWTSSSARPRPQVDRDAKTTPSGLSCR